METASASGSTPVYNQEREFEGKDYGPVTPLTSERPGYWTPETEHTYRRVLNQMLPPDSPWYQDKSLRIFAVPPRTGSSPEATSSVRDGSDGTMSGAVSAPAQQPRQPRPRQFRHRPGRRPGR